MRFQNIRACLLRCDLHLARISRRCWFRVRYRTISAVSPGSSRFARPRHGNPRRARLEHVQFTNCYGLRPRLYEARQRLAVVPVLGHENQPAGFPFSVSRYPTFREGYKREYSPIISPTAAVPFFLLVDTAAGAFGTAGTRPAGDCRHAQYQQPDRD